MKDYYRILEVEETASPDAIKSAYRKLAMQFHPDKNMGNEVEAEAKMKELNEANDVLSNPQKRQLYDMQRHPPQRVMYRVVAVAGFGGFGSATATNDGYFTGTFIWK